MIFPSISLRGTAAPDDAVGQIDRALNDRNHRLMAGLSLEPHFEKVRGALVVSQGNGKYLRLRHAVEAEQEIQPAVQAGLREITESGRAAGHKNELHGQSALAPLLSDLSETQAAVIEKLKCEAGKYVDRVLAVTVNDPGLWIRDFDGRESYSPLCDATQLAETSGVSVIDALPARDLAVNGSGRRLEAIPYWLMFADRDRRVANQNCALVTLGKQNRLYRLPPSDGLDAEVPDIRVAESLGFSFLDTLLQNFFPDHPNLAYVDQMYAAGRQMPELRKYWEDAVDELLEISNSNPNNQGDAEGLLNQRMIEIAEEFINRTSDSLAHVIRTAISWTLDLLLEQVQNAPGPRRSFNELFVSCSPLYEASVTNELTQRLKDCKISLTSQPPFGYRHLEPIVAAIHGLLHIDQMPGNVPWLTGADSQRILGRLTPGRPSNWRQLLRVMADFHPAPMKLRDAV